MFRRGRGCGRGVGRSRRPGRTILAYKAEFDRSIILGDTARAGRKPMHLADPNNWGCVMNRRSDWLRTSRWLALGGGHRALGDCHSARDVLVDIARLPELPRRDQAPVPSA